ncbi:FAD-dependent oxidoreductase [Sorangium sp. So ce176]|uniref:FAD-dependent oxidoreductase n=1 Tax=Sorangium sp. So ce176 TaxID=3133286 RepID=UPI003F629CB9
MSRAIVIGGSIAGMCSARVLCDFFDEVVILDRDQFPAEIAPRPGVPQSRHTHVLLTRGEQELEALFPGFTAAMMAAGALRFDVGTGMAVRRVFGWQTVGPTGRELLWASRDLFEGTIRSLMRQQTKVRVREGSQVLALRSTAGERPRIKGVLLRDDAAEQELEADLVVDASGRHTRAEQWLTELGLPAPKTQSVDSRAGYASRFYKVPPPERRPSDWWWKGLWVEAEPDRPRGAVVFPIEGDRWLVTASGFSGSYPPTDEQGFLEHLASLSSPIVARAVALAEPISPIYGNRSMANVSRAYDSWEIQLPGFVAVGDAACAFNPVYGQGMSTSTVSAVILRDVLRRHGPGAGFEPAFFQQQARFLRSVWDFATRSDFRWPGTVGERPRTPAIIGAYAKLAIESAHHDSAIRRHLFPAFDLTGSAALLFEPLFVGKVLLSAGQRRLRQRLLGAPPVSEAPPVPAGVPRGAAGAAT